MYVANSEPAIWRWGRGRAVVTRRGLISGVRNRCEAGRDMGRCVRLTQGSPTGLVSNAVRDTIKLSRRGEPEAGRGQRVADSRVVLRIQGR